MEPHTIGTDLGKTVFHLVGLNLCSEKHLTDSRHLNEISFDTL
jgi:hypothetical protein